MRLKHFIFCLPCGYRRLRPSAEFGREIVTQDIPRTRRGKREMAI